MGEHNILLLLGEYLMLAASSALSLAVGGTCLLQLPGRSLKCSYCVQNLSKYEMKNRQEVNSTLRHMVLSNTWAVSSEFG